MSIDHVAFNAVYDEYAPKIFTYCYFRVNSREDAEDIASGVFIKTWNYISAGNEIDNMKAFLYTTASNLVIDFYRTSKKKQEMPVENPVQVIDIPQEANFVEAMDHQFAIKQIRSMLRELPEAYHDIVVLRYINDFSINEIAQVTGLTENNVSVRLHRAIDKLREISKQV